MATFLPVCGVTDPIKLMHNSMSARGSAKLRRVPTAEETCCYARSALDHRSALWSGDVPDFRSAKPSGTSARRRISGTACGQPTSNIGGAKHARICKFCNPVRPFHHMSVGVIDTWAVRVAHDQASQNFVSIRGQDKYCLTIS